ncbi:MAG: hypothetical protein V8S82_05810 [Eubacteriales bacterium]
MGVEGAAIATAISRFAELGIVVIATHTDMPFVAGLIKRSACP